MRKGGTEITVNYPDPIPSHTQQLFIVGLACAWPVSGPRESQVKELVWASSHPQRGTGRTKVLRDLTGEKGRARIETRWWLLSTLPLLWAWPARHGPVPAGIAPPWLCSLP